MAKDINHDIPVQGSSYVGSDRAKQAVKSANGAPITPDTSGNPSGTQSDRGTEPSTQKSLKQTDKPTVLDTTTKPIAGGSNPNLINQSGRPGLGASSWPKKDNKGK